MQVIVLSEVLEYFEDLVVILYEKIEKQFTYCVTSLIIPHQQL